MGAQKNHLIETVLSSTHNICFGWEIKKIFFQITHLSGGWYQENRKKNQIYFG